jgi:hypothetical protein
MRNYVPLVVIDEVTETRGIDNSEMEAYAVFLNVWTYV